MVGYWHRIFKVHLAFLYLAGEMGMMHALMGPELPLAITRDKSLDTFNGHVATRSNISSSVAISALPVLLPKVAVDCSGPVKPVLSLLPRVRSQSFDVVWFYVHPLNCGSKRVDMSITGSLQLFVTGVCFIALRLICPKLPSLQFQVL